MNNLDTILAGMEDVLFMPVDNNDYKSNGNVLYAEDIPNEVAEELLEPGDYDSQYSYKLLTTPESFVVTKYNPTDMSIISDYTIDKDVDVQSFTEMTRAVLMHDKTSFLYNGEDSDIIDYDTTIEDGFKFKPDWRFYLIVTLFFLAGVSLALHVFVSTLQ